MPVNFSILEAGKSRAIRFSALESIYRALECQPADVWSILEK
jgi:DNA-binding Xre family transcriptional regulator